MATILHLFWIIIKYEVFDVERPWPSAHNFSVHSGLEPSFPTPPSLARTSPSLLVTKRIFHKLKSAEGRSLTCSTMLCPLMKIHLWMTVVLDDSVLCNGQLGNLRPLQGILHEVTGSGRFSDGDLLGAETGGVGGSLATEADVLKALREGYRRTEELLLQESLEGTRFRTGMDHLEQSSKFLFSFRRAEPEAKKASSCMGRSMLEATKYITETFNLTTSDSFRLLSKLNSLVNDQLCKQLMPKGCKAEKILQCSATNPYRSIDGTCNNLQYPKWGSAMSPFVRYLLPAYEDGVDSMRGENRRGSFKLPSPRRVSYLVKGAGKRPLLPYVSLMVMQWGQFIDHEVVHTPEAARENSKGETMALNCCVDGEHDPDGLESPECKPIDVSDDPVFSRHNRTCMRFVRSLIASKGCTFGPREQLNQITAYIDGSAVYGSTPDVARILRSFNGGHLHKIYGDSHVSSHLLPEINCPHSKGFCFKAGDERVNEQPALASMHTLWLRVHEGLVKQFSYYNPQWSDETLYQESRRVVSALMQQITYKEFLPVVLGDAIMWEYDLYPSSYGYKDNYDPNVDASIANVFATAAYRFGHTLVNDILKSSEHSIPLLGNFMNPHILHQKRTRPSALLEGLVNEPAQAADAYLVPTLTERLFAGLDDPVGLDLMALNIQRGRDHGLPPYNAWRSACGLPPYLSFADLASDMGPPAAEAFRRAYRTVEDIDLFPAGLAERSINGGLLGPTFSCIIGQQFSNIKTGDRFWYERKGQPKPFTLDQLMSIRNQTLASIICHHTDLAFLPPHIFYTTNSPGNQQISCASYPRLNTQLWKEEEEKEGITDNEVNASGIRPVNCKGVGLWQILPDIDNWCTNQLLARPSFCPSSHCYCTA
ncbi:myeloperoxidase-like [Palaemon carinicauda]|uniref:myeloperoxidase-like n=1 Tax=Palaemon carinicauda TaxID=392227 RepID=UPI0035B586B7